MKVKRLTAQHYLGYREHAYWSFLNKGSDMALVNCRECRLEVSDKASKCPKCGIDAPGQNPEPEVEIKMPKEKMSWGKVIFLSFLIFVLGYITTPTKEESLLLKLKNPDELSLIEISDAYNELYSINSNNNNYKNKASEYAIKTKEIRRMTNEINTLKILNEIPKIKDNETLLTMYKKLNKMHPLDTNYIGEIDYLENRIRAEKEEAEEEKRQKAIQQALKEKKEQESRDTESNTRLHGEISLRARLRDGSSAKIKDVRYYDSTAPVICGKVNAKNGFGAFQGYQGFISNGTSTMTFLEEGSGSHFSTIWNDLCR